MIDDADLGIEQRSPGEFRRHPSTGAPWVADPVATRSWPKAKAELLAIVAKNGLDITDIDFTGKSPTVKQLTEYLTRELGAPAKMVQYGRPSGLGKQIEDSTNLQKWAERMVALGIGSDGELISAAVDLAGMDHESAEFRHAADAIARRAKTVAQAHLAAERGTHHHELTEDFDNDRDPVERFAAGEQLGVSAAVQTALLQAWAEMLHAFDIEILATEATCVDDEWRMAGTLDRVCRLQRDLRFVTTGGEIVTLPAGWVGILDIKTGRLRLDNNGFVAFWLGYAVQCASYAQSVRYNPDTDERTAWEWPIDQRWAIIAHLDVLAALDGEAVCRLVLVDLEAGRHAGALAVAARAWEKRIDVLSIPTDDLAVRVKVSTEGFPTRGEGSDREATDPAVEPGSSTSPSVDTGVSEVPAASSLADDGAAVDPPDEIPPSPATAAPSDDLLAQLEASVIAAKATRANHQTAPFADLPARLSQILDHKDGRQHLGTRWIAAGIPFKPKNLDEILAHRAREPFPDDTALEQARKVIEQTEAALSLPFLDAPVSPLVVEDAPPAPPPPAELDEGDEADPAAVEKIAEWLGTLNDDMRAAIAKIAKEANRHGTSLSLAILPSVRRFEAARAMKLVDDITDGDAEAFTYTLAACVRCPAPVLGETLGHMDKGQMVELAFTAQRFADEELVLRFDDTGTAYLATP